MKPTIMKKWVRALRSGRYQQGESALATNWGAVMRYCCLGVLCELHRKSTRTKTKLKWTQHGELWSYGERNNYPPEAVLRWAGLKAANPQLLTGRGIPEAENLSDTIGAANMNDLGTKFTTIADAIERTQKAKAL